MSSPPTWDQLVGDPQLAALHILGVVLTVAQRALLSAHPQLVEANARPFPELSAVAKSADNILAHIARLQAALQRYPQELLRHHHRMLREEREIPF